MTQQNSRTPTEQQRAAKRSAVVHEYLSIEANREMIEQRDQTTLTPHRIMGMVAGQFQMTVPGVRNILIKAGIYKTR